MDKNRIHKNSSDEWYTPKYLLDMLEDKENIKFEIDPCVPIGYINTRFKIAYSSDVNGLDKEWDGVTWLNPPFSNKIAWINKAIVQFYRYQKDIYTASYVFGNACNARAFKNWQALYSQ